MYAIADGVYRHCKRVCKEADSGRKILYRNRKSNLCRWHASLMLYQLSYNPHPMRQKTGCRRNKTGGRVQDAGDEIESGSRGRIYKAEDRVQEKEDRR